MTVDSRTKGLVYERKAVRWLRDHDHPDARRYLQGDGRQPGDLDALPGVCIDVKARQKLAIPEWLAQVKKEAGPDRLPLLWIWRPGLADPGDWWAVARWEDLHDTIGDCLT